MQLLSSKSYEFSEHNGLNLIPGDVIKFSLPRNYKSHTLVGTMFKFKIDHPLANEIKINSDFYFVHSYHFKCHKQEHTWLPHMEIHSQV